VHRYPDRLLLIEKVVVSDLQIGAVHPRKALARTTGKVERVPRTILIGAPVTRGPAGIGMKRDSGTDAVLGANQPILGAEHLDRVTNVAREGAVLVVHDLHGVEDAGEIG